MSDRSPTCCGGLIGRAARWNPWRTVRKARMFMKRQYIGEEWQEILCPQPRIKSLKTGRLQKFEVGYDIRGKAISKMKVLPRTSLKTNWIQI
jgi:hypothetical protein